MRKHLATLVVLAATGLCGLMAFAILRSSEPTYAGHTLSYWLDRHQESILSERIISYRFLRT